MKSRTESRNIGEELRGIAGSRVVMLLWLYAMVVVMSPDTKVRDVKSQCKTCKQARESRSVET